ncbi:MAG: DUF1622 domain-containing protein [Methanomicrobiales archaeon]|nr:DUF1622 domain-containing protein [Methanomicrobiales archaeon]
MFEDIVRWVAYFFSGVGAILIAYGGIRAIIDILRREIFSRETTYDAIRRPFTGKIIFGLEFFIAADIIKTLIAPGQQEILLLGAVVLIRVVLGYFLSREAHEYKIEG